MTLRRRSGLGLGLLAATVTAGALTVSTASPTPRPCTTAPSPHTVDGVMRALRSGRDVWGNALLASPQGPTYAGASRRLAPLLFARAAGGASLTRSGVYYLPFAVPNGARGADSVALHVADGSEILAQRAGGRSLDVLVGARAGERYGSCLARLTPARLADGWLPILQTAYVDATGVLYKQESFAGRPGGTGPLVSFVRLSADARHAAAGARARIGSLTWTVPRGGVRTVYARWAVQPTAHPLAELDATAYDRARAEVVRYWRPRVAEGMTISVPERRVMDAERALLVQDLVLTWRYSVGNAYEEFSFPEGVDVAEVLAEQGLGPVARAILLTSLQRPTSPYPNWKRGERLLASASYYRLFRDRGFVEQATPVLRGFVSALGDQLPKPGSILRRERYSSDIPDTVYGLHSQAMAWQGLRAMASVWAATGHAGLAAESKRAAARFEPGLRRAVRASQRRLPDGSLFLPARLLDGERPYGSLVADRLGSYWNLVMPYALASGLFPPGGPEARGALRYMLLHGSRLLGLVRAGAYALYGRSAPFPVSGTDEVYGVNVARFLADNGQADQLVLSLYGELAAAMTPRTFVSGEGASVAPLHGESYRSMYLPPNGASNAAFLETLRLMLVHETLDRAGAPHGLQLAYSTPRAWLRPGRRIEVRGAPTSFGPVSYSIAARPGSVHASVQVPGRSRPRALGLRLRLPRGSRIAAVTLDGHAYRRFDPATGTINLSGRAGTLNLAVAVR